MDRAIVQALAGLLPTLNGSLPPELIELAASLLAQSRSKASSLKAEEEIARSYACAHLACERLKQTLNLPKIQPRPPCPPKVYQKLYKYLDAALPARARRSNRSIRASGLDSTPATSLAKPRTPAKQAYVRPGTQRKAVQRLAVGTLETPEWVMPVIRGLCKKMGAPAAPHHIFAGVSSILSAQGISSDSIPEAHSDPVNAPALVIAVYILATTRLSGAEMPATEYQRQRGQALTTLKELVGAGLEMDNIGSIDVDNCMRQVRDQGWTEMDWFENIPAGAGLGVGDGAEESAEVNEDLDEGGQLLPVKRRDVVHSGLSDQHYLQAGLGTMMQDRVDYLSDDRRREYQQWRKNILIQIEELEKSQEMRTEAG